MAIDVCIHFVLKDLQETAQEHGRTEIPAAAACGRVSPQRRVVVSAAVATATAAAAAAVAVAATAATGTGCCCLVCRRRNDLRSALSQPPSPAQPVEDWGPCRLLAVAAAEATGDSRAARPCRSVATATRTLLMLLLLLLLPPLVMWWCCFGGLARRCCSGLYPRWGLGGHFADSGRPGQRREKRGSARGSVRCTRASPSVSLLTGATLFLALLRLLCNAAEATPCLCLSPATYFVSARLSLLCLGI